MELNLKLGQEEIFIWVIVTKVGIYLDLQGVPQNMSDLVFLFFNPLKCIPEKKSG